MASTSNVQQSDNGSNPQLSTNAFVLSGETSQEGPRQGRKTALSANISLKALHHQPKFLTSQCSRVTERCENKSGTITKKMDEDFRQSNFFAGERNLEHRAALEHLFSETSIQ